MTKAKDLCVLRGVYDKHRPQGRTLIVGSKLYEGSVDRRSWYPDREVLGVDLQDGDGVDVVHDMQHRLSCLHGTFQHVDCCSVLEHCARPWLVAQNIEWVMEPGASILLSVPFAWRVHGYPSDYYRFTREAIPILFPGIKWLTLFYTANGEKRKAPHGKPGYVERTEVVGYGVMK